MRKIWLCAFSLIAVMILFTGCDKTNNPMVVDKPTVDGPSLWVTSPPSNAYSTPILAGQDIDVGDVYIWNTSTQLYVYYRIEPSTDAGEGWLMTEYHCDVELTWADVPKNGQGVPEPGHFYYKSEEVLDPGITEKLLVIPLTTAMEDAGSVVIVAHCVVVQYDNDGNIIQTQTGFGFGTPFPDIHRWGWYIEWDLDNHGKWMNLPEGAVTVQGSGLVNCGPAYIYPNVIISNVPDADPPYDVVDNTYNAWCLDMGIYIYGNTYPATLYASNDLDKMPDYIRYNRSATHPHPVDLTKPTPYAKINYLLNIHIPAYVPVNPTP